MVNKIHFNGSDIKEQLISQITAANINIKAAIAWFTDIEIFKAILASADRGVKIELILMDDEINKNSKVDFAALEEANVSMFWFSTSNDGLMHHKFCIIDMKVVLSGSYNWTYNASKINRENMTITTDKSVIKEFVKEFLFLREELKDVYVKPKPTNKLIPYVKFTSVFSRMIGKWGFCDENFNLIIPFEYDEVRFFKEEMAAIRKGELWGFTDQLGIETVKCKYAFVSDFSNGIAACFDGYYMEVTKEDYDDDGLYEYTENVEVGKWGCINTSGKTIIAFNCKSQKEAIQLYEKDIVKHNTGNYFHTYTIRVPENEDLRYNENEEGNRLDVPESHLVEHYLNTEVVDFRDKNKNILLSYSEIISELRASNPHGIGHWYGLNLKILDEDVFLIKLIAYYREDRGYSNQLQETSPPQYVENWVFINSDGNILANRPRIPSSNFVNGLAKVEEWHEHYSDSIIDDIYEEYLDLIDSDLSSEKDITYCSLTGFINKKGEIIIPVQYESKYVGDYRDELIRVRVGGRYGYINASNEQVIPFNFVEASDFSEGLAAVKINKDSYYYFINTNGEKNINNNYEKIIKPFEEGLAFVEINKCQFYVDKLGNEYYEYCE